MTRPPRVSCLGNRVAHPVCATCPFLNQLRATVVGRPVKTIRTAQSRISPGICSVLAMATSFRRNSKGLHDTLRRVSVSCVSWECRGRLRRTRTC